MQSIIFFWIHMMGYAMGCIFISNKATWRRRSLDSIRIKQYGYQPNSEGRNDMEMMYLADSIQWICMNIHKISQNLWYIYTYIYVYNHWRYSQQAHLDRYIPWIRFCRFGSYLRQGIFTDVLEEPLNNGARNEPLLNGDRWICTSNGSTMLLRSREFIVSAQHQD